MTESTVVPALPSATVVVARNSPGGPELLMVQRREGDVFGASYAFPGGLVDADEHVSWPLIAGRTAHEADKLLGVEEGGLDYYVAAIRELFEETGLLLVRDARGRMVKTTPDLQELRCQVDQGELPWSQFLERRQLQMACDALHYFDHWETPVSRPKRWSTRFFLAKLPPEQEPNYESQELTDGRWLRAADALVLDRRGELKLPYPTRRILLALADFVSLEQLCDWAREQSLQGVQGKRPIEIVENGRLRVVIQGDPGYPQAENNAN